MKAFPTDVPSPDGRRRANYDSGMDLRDYFAAKVMQYWLCNPINNMQIEKLCKGAYQVADAMMEARKQ